MKKSETVRERVMVVFHLLEKSYTIFRKPVRIFLQAKAKGEGSCTVFLVGPKYSHTTARGIWILFHYIKYIGLRK